VVFSCNTHLRVELDFMNAEMFSCTRKYYLLLDVSRSFWKMFCFDDAISFAK
jgi:hypothetical protein